MSKSKNEVYSISGFKDTLASPVFYPVIVVAMVLGITSIFGFVQNPMKLKTVVDVIHQKIAVNDVLDNKYYPVKFYSQLDDTSSKINFSIVDSFFKKNKMKDNQTPKVFNIYTDITSSDLDKVAISADFERVTFNYDVTSDQFWNDLDSSKLESAGEEAERQAREAAVFGIPLGSDYRESIQQEFNTKDIYALNKNKI